MENELQAPLGSAGSHCSLKYFIPWQRVSVDVLSLLTVQIDVADAAFYNKWNGLSRILQERKGKREKITGLLLTKHRKHIKDCKTRKLVLWSLVRGQAGKGGVTNMEPSKSAEDTVCSQKHTRKLSLRCVKHCCSLSGSDRGLPRGITAIPPQRWNAELKYLS